MQTTLTIQERLKNLRVERNLILDELAEQTGISRSALSNHENKEDKDISHTALIKLAKFYGVTTDYLLGLTDTKNHSGTDLSDLHLSDEMIELLKSRKLNNRLLCELVLHKDFRKLMVDIEIYVDRIVSMRIRDFNVMLEIARDEVIRRYDPDRNDVTLQTLEAAAINENEYFSYKIHEDIDPIIRDIREAHKSDSTTADQESSSEMIIDMVKAWRTFKGSKQEKELHAFCYSCGIDYNKLTDQEIFTLCGILNKSKHLRNRDCRRGKKSAFNLR